MIPNVCNYEKSEIVDLLLREEYGYLPAAPLSVKAELVERDKKFCAGKADLGIYNLVCECDFGSFSFPIRVAIPKKDTPVPAFVHINFRPEVPDKYQPTEEIIDAGYAVLSFCYKEVTSDDGDFTDGLAGLVYPEGKRDSDSCGKIGLWAWAAMRVLDYALTLDSIDPSRISVTGHSRLGKTALLAGMLDERFYCGISNDSGCSGASIARDNDGETVKKIVDRFPYWFCENYYKYSDNEDAMPFDQHFLVAANYPHRVYVASADGDAWACPKNEFLSCTLAGEFYKKHGGVGFIHNGEMPECGEPIVGGDVGYHIRKGSHYQSREDWKYYIEFLES
ncbi:MAG: alpha/beta hydrolase [Clostridia bacterium]|nr:alpha/beta hydrolase [Clostridia bacterium]